MEFLSNVAEYAKKAAPWISAAATSNIPALVTLAADALSNATGKPVDKTNDAMITAVANASPDELLKIKQADNDFAVQMRRMDLDFFSAEVADRSSARSASVQGSTARELLALSILLIAVCLFAEIAVLFNGVPKEVPDLIIGRVLGLLDAVLMMVLTFYYGASRTGQIKDDSINILSTSMRKDQK